MILNNSISHHRMYVSYLYKNKTLLHWIIQAYGAFIIIIVILANLYQFFSYANSNSTLSNGADVLPFNDNCQLTEHSSFCWGMYDCSKAICNNYRNNINVTSVSLIPRGYESECLLNMYDSMMNIADKNKSFKVALYFQYITIVNTCVLICIWLFLLIYSAVYNYRISNYETIKQYYTQDNTPCRINNINLCCLLERIFWILLTFSSMISIAVNISLIIFLAHVDNILVLIIDYILNSICLLPLVFNCYVCLMYLSGQRCK